MSYQYDQYLTNHKFNVKKGFEWIRDNLPELTNQEFDLEYQICFAHDHSKTEKDEYDAYDAYFYGGNKSYSVTQEFNRAWLLHIHRNPHHWQYEIFPWYEEHKDYIQLHSSSRLAVEGILSLIKLKLEENNDSN